MRRPKQMKTHAHNRATAGSVEPSRLRNALRGPGMDTRRWAFLAFVEEGEGDPEDSIDIKDSGVWLDCVIAETGEQIRVRWVAQMLPDGRGLWMPPPKPGTEILVVAGDGDPEFLACGFGSFFHEGDDAVPQEILANPNRVYLWNPDGDIQIHSNGQVILGDPDTALEVARKEDAVKSTSVEDSAFWSWFDGVWTAIAAAVVGPDAAALKAALISQGTPPTSLTGKIIEGCDKVKAGDDDGGEVGGIN